MPRGSFDHLVMGLFSSYLGNVIASSSRIVMCVFLCSALSADTPASHILLHSKIFWCIVFLFFLDAFSGVDKTVDSKQEATYIFRYKVSQKILYIL